MKQALLLIDIQNDYFPGGAMELAGSVEAGAKAGRLLEVFRRNALDVVHVQHISLRPGATFFLPKTDGARIHPCVAPLAGETVIQKHFPNSFRETPLLEHLRGRGIERLVIAGMMTHMCIDTTTRAAADLGFTCALAGDACATKDLSRGAETTTAAQVQAAFLAALNGIFADVRTAQELAAAL
ncbi:MAG: cysteine hydrolase [Elusimicrobia bacterium]|nr:cysteine hydrolase [Elusimicrobiota bacterium]